MEEKGYVQSRTEADRGEPGLPRRLYKATASGRRLFDVWAMVRVKLSLEPA
jgi:DNA-binding PadR family transcriptional regulator